MKCPCSNIINIPKLECNPELDNQRHKRMVQELITLNRLIAPIIIHKPKKSNGSNDS